MSDVAAGLGAMAFWMFLAAVVVAGIWYDLRRREAQQETLRRIIESGQAVDKELIGQILTASAESSNLGRDLKVGGLIVVFCAPGLAVLGYFLGMLTQAAFLPLIGAAFLVGFVGIGLLVAAWVVEHRYPENQG